MKSCFSIHLQCIVLVTEKASMIIEHGADLKVLVLLENALPHAVDYVTYTYNSRLPV
jgi:hypothetical protein